MVLPLDVTAARQAAALQRTLQQQGQVIGLPDTLIAGVCLAQQIPLLTRNSRHYECSKKPVALFKNRMTRQHVISNGAERCGAKREIFSVGAKASLRRKDFSSSLLEMT